MILALAGRRIDAPDAPERRFPAENAARVQRKIREALVQADVTALVCSAACGADILALEAAGEQGARRRVVLPFDKEIFKQSSVINRPGDWVARFDRILPEVESRGDLIVYDYDKDREETYFATNHDILDNAEEIARELGEDLTVLVVWNGESRGSDDVTGHFVEEAKRRGLHLTSISTL